MSYSTPTLNLQEIDVTDLKLSDEQQKLFDRFENTQSHMFITGKAGTGKSVLLQYIKLHTQKNLVPKLDLESSLSTKFPHLTVLQN